MNVTATPPVTAAASNPSPASGRPIAVTGSAMRAIISKEVRPNLPYAIGIVGILGLIAMIPAMSDMLRPIPLPPSRVNILSNADFQGVLWFVAACIGFLMGAVQGRSSRTPDAWAFMIHRPISRGKLFLGKLLGAAFLYGLAAGVPMIGLLLYAGLSRTMPYHWRFDLPVLAAFVGGFLFSIGGLLVMERKAFILGSATIPLLTIVLGLVAAALVPMFTVALLILAVTGLIVGLAAWGSHASDGYELRAPAWARAALVLVLSIGFTLLLGLPSQLIKQSMRSAYPPTPTLFGSGMILAGSGGASPGKPFSHATTYLFLPDGTIGRKEEENTVGNYPGVIEHRERFVREDSPNSELDAASLKKELTQLDARTSLFSLPPPPPSYTDVEAKNDTIYGSSSEGEAGEVWYFIRTAGVVRGYDRRSGVGLGTIGADGWVPPGESVVAFRGWNTDGHIFVGPRGLYEVDIPKRTSTLRLEVPSGEAVEGWCYVHSAALADEKEQGEVYMAAISAHHVYIKRVGRAGPMIDLPTGTTKLGGREVKITHFVEAGRWGLLGGPLFNTGAVRGRDITFQVFDDAGKLLAERAVPQLQVTDPPPVASLPESEESSLGMYAAGTADAISNMPAVWAFSLIAKNPLFASQPGWVYRLFAPRADVLYAAPAAEVLLVSALFAWLLARVFGLRAKWLWVLLALICGPVVVLVMMSTHRAQRATACPSCGKSRYVFTEKCPACGAEFPAAAANGTEILTL